MVLVANIVAIAIATPTEMRHREFARFRRTVPGSILIGTNCRGERRQSFQTEVAMPRLPGEDCLTSNLDEPNHVELAGRNSFLRAEHFAILRFRTARSPAQSVTDLPVGQTTTIHASEGWPRARSEASWLAHRRKRRLERAFRASDHDSPMWSREFALPLPAGPAAFSTRHTIRYRR